MFINLCITMAEKAMAPHSSTLVWKIPWMEEPGRLQSMGSLTVRHNWATSLSLFTFLHWRRKWQPTPVLLPGESQGRGSLVGCRLWRHTVGHDWSDLAAAAALLRRLLKFLCAYWSQVVFFPFSFSEKDLFIPLFHFHTRLSCFLVFLPFLKYLLCIDF